MTVQTAPKHSVVRASFTITRNWPHPPATVFHAFANEQAKRKWFAGPPGWEEHEKSFDFREGGRETLKGKHPNGMVSSFDCVYRDIVPGQRIIYSYVMHLDGRKISVSQATIEFEPDGEGDQIDRHRIWRLSRRL